MKFLIMCTVKDTFSMVPSAISRQLFEASVAWINQLKKAGKVLEIYSTSGWGRIVAICEHPSAEDVAQTLATAPMGGFLNFEVYPLADFNQSMKAIIEAYKVAEQMFPAKK